MLASLEFGVLRERLSHIIASGPEHLRPVFSAVRDYGCGLLIVGHRCGPFALPTNGKPWIAIVADDVDESLGPSGFHRKSLQRLVRAASHGTIVSSRAEQWIYSLAATPAVLTGQRCLIIETRIEHELEWIAFAQKVNSRLMLVISTIKGGTA